jgi:hypothetical protein
MLTCPGPIPRRDPSFVLGAVSDNACPDIDCKMEGQADLYGLGTRVGIYLTWGASLLNNGCLPKEYDGALDSNTVFLIAIAIAVICYSTTHQLRTIDVIILLQLSLGFVFTVMTVWGYRTCVYWKELGNGVKRFGGIGTYVRLCILSTISGYNIWFWSFGYRGGWLRSCNNWGNCHHDLRVFLFGVTLDLLSGKLRKSYLALSSFLAT